MSNDLSRRHFIQSAGVAGLGMAALGSSAFGRVSPNSQVNVLSIGVIGTIGGHDRNQVAEHPAARITGLCDVDSTGLGPLAMARQPG